MPFPEGYEAPVTRHAYDVRALSEARVAGLHAGELATLLEGGTPTVVIPPLPGECIATYADRAVSVLLVRYIARWQAFGGMTSVPGNAIVWC